jgi:hypothetical protein
MPNQRKKGVKLVGAYIDKDMADELPRVAERLGFDSVAHMMRELIEQAIDKEKQKSVLR